MAFQPGISGNSAGRPVGAKSKVGLPVRAKKQLLKQMHERALSGDTEAQNRLFEYAFLKGVNKGDDK